MKRILTLLFCLQALMVFADNYGDYYTQLPVQMNQVSKPQIPERRVSIKDFGAVGDGATLCTEAFSRAIAQLTTQGGGHVDVPAGVWLTGPIQLESNIDLHLDRNAIIYFSPDKRLYLCNDVQKKAWGNGRALPCISAYKKQNVTITGSGIIDGNGQQWRPVKRSKVSDTEWKEFRSMGGIEQQDGQLWYPWQMKSGYPDIADTPEQQERMRNDLVRFLDCENVLFQGVTFQHAPRFHVHPCYCTNVIIDGITVRCPWNAQNGDAIDISDCHRVLIVNSMVDAGDDGLCMKSGKPRKSSAISGVKDVLIDNCTVFHAHGGFVLGSETASGVRRVVVRNCRFSGTDTGLRFKSGLDRGGKTEQLYIHDCVMTDIKDEAIIFQCDYVNRPAGSDANAMPTFTEEQRHWAPNFQDIHISNITCRGAKTAISASGILGLDCVHDIDISNSTLIYRKNGMMIDENTAQLQLNNVTIEKEGAPTDSYETDIFKTKSGKTVKFHALVHASIRIEYDGKDIMIDPVTKLGNKTIDYSTMPKADYIVVTHEHGDHFDKEAIRQLTGDGTRLITNRRCAEMLGYGEVMSNGDKMTVADGITISAVPAYNTTDGRQQFHPKGRDNGYVLTIDGLRIYVAGDTEDIPEMADIAAATATVDGQTAIDIAFLPCNQPYTMTADQLVNAARMVKAKVVFPYHYGRTDVSGIPALLAGDGIDVRIRHYE